MNQSTTDIVMVAAMVLAAMWTVMTARLLRSVVGLAVTSVILTIIMYRLHSPLAAVFELSVCAGLIPALFFSAITLTRRSSPNTVLERSRQQARRFWYLPVLLLVTGVLLTQASPFELKTLAPATAADVRTVLWTDRKLDLLGQIVVLLGGVFGVVTLLKEPKHG